MIACKDEYLDDRFDGSKYSTGMLGARWMSVKIERPEKWQSYCDQCIEAAIKAGDASELCDLHFVCRSCKQVRIFQDLAAYENVCKRCTTV